MFRSNTSSSHKAERQITKRRAQKKKSSRIKRDITECESLDCEFDEHINICVVFIIWHLFVCLSFFWVNFWHWTRFFHAKHDFFLFSTTPSDEIHILRVWHSTQFSQLKIWKKKAQNLKRKMEIYSYSARFYIRYACVTIPWLRSNRWNGHNPFLCKSYTNWSWMSWRWVE